MKKVTLFDRRYFFITDDKLQPLKDALAGTGMIDIDSVDGKNYVFPPRAVMLIEQGSGPELRDLIPKERQLPEEAPKVVTKDSPGYKLYLKKRDELARKLKLK